MDLQQSRPEQWLLLAGTVSGAIVFLAQHKGWNYHKYLGLVFGCLLLVLLLRGALQSGMRPRRWLGWAALLIVVAQLARVSLPNRQDDRVAAQRVDLLDHLQAALLRSGARDHQVQCLDMTYTGCINTLYRMRLAQATGYIYDYYLLSEKATPTTRTLQASFLSQVQQAPPIIVLSSHVWPGDYFSYQHLQHWPAFAAWLQDRYRVQEQYAQPTGAGYRLYVLKH